MAAVSAATAANAAADKKQPPNVEPAAPLTELEEIQLQMNRVTDDSLESTRRMLTMCNDAKEAGINTLVMLDEQGEQLEKIEEGLDKINSDMKEAEKTIEKMEKCCGLCVLPWKKAKSFEKDAAYAATWKKDEDAKGGGDGPRIVVGQEAMCSGGFITRITKDAREDEMENNITEVNQMIGNLRNMAVDMGTEIEGQNRLLDRVNQKAESNTARVNQANQRANKLLQ